MEKSVCVSCQKPKALLTCVSCEGDLCKSCAQFVDQNTFPFLTAMPADLKPGRYCIQCYDDKAAPEVAAYEGTIAKAHNIPIFMKNQSKETRSLKRAQYPVKVEKCEDKAETLLRLAFLTVNEDYDTLINVELSPKKWRDGSYQKTEWYGVGTPAVARVKRKPAAAQD